MEEYIIVVKFFKFFICFIVCKYWFGILFLILCVCFVSMERILGRSIVFDVKLDMFFVMVDIFIIFLVSCFLRVLKFVLRI